MASGTANLKEIYEAVIEDVMQGIEELFLEDGVKKSVLENLKRMWKAKLRESGALSNNEEMKIVPAAAAAEAETVPVQIILLTEPVLNLQKVWAIQLPVSTISEQVIDVNKMINKDIVHTTTNPPEQDNDLTIQKCDQKLTTMSGSSGIVAVAGPSGLCAQKSNSKRKKIKQIDGGQDSSSEYDSNSDAEEDVSGKWESKDEPLNSDDDISDEDENFETENIIVCQYEKIMRRFNKWKFYLKNGIMNVDGKDHVFKWFVGEADW